MGAKVTAEDRRKYGDEEGKYPMKTADDIEDAINLRHNSKPANPAKVLARASRAISRLLAAGEITASRASALRAKVARAREKDRSKS